MWPVTRSRLGAQPASWPSRYIVCPQASCMNVSANPGTSTDLIWGRRASPQKLIYGGFRVAVSQAPASVVQDLIAFGTVVMPSVPG
jgi:hypothetical protein